MSGVPSVVGGDRLLRRFFELADDARRRGISRRLIEDKKLDDPSMITLDGKCLVNFTSCGYLGINIDPRLKEGAIRAVERFGTSYSSSPAYSALPLYGELTEKLRAMMGASVVLAPTTTLAHMAALPLLIRSDDWVVMDSAAHASVQMALELTRTNPDHVLTAEHGSAEHLERSIERACAGSSGNVWYLADSVYSMHGDTAPFGLIRELQARYSRLWAYIDDAHGFSWAGLNGRGMAPHSMGWHERLVVAGGLSKSFAATGGFVASSDEEIVDLIELCGSPLSFGGPIPPAALGAGIASADIHLSGEHAELNKALLARLDVVEAVASSLGISFGTPASPIRYVEVRRTETMFAIVAALKSDGYYLNGAMFPIVPAGHAGIRFTVSLSVGEEQTRSMLARLSHHLRVFGVIPPEIVVDLAEIEKDENLGRR